MITDELETVEETEQTETVSEEIETTTDTDEIEESTEEEETEEVSGEETESSSIQYIVLEAPAGETIDYTDILTAQLEYASVAVEQQQEFNISLSAINARLACILAVILTMWLFLAFRVRKGVGK